MKTISNLKILRPKIPHAYKRTGFFLLADNCRETKNIIWLSSPPGAGKTTFASSYIEERKLPCLWYIIEEVDADPATFFYYMNQAVAAAGIKTKKALPLFTSEYQGSPEEFAKNYFRILFSSLKEGTIIVFDNYQELNKSGQLHELLCEGLQRMPKGVTAMFLSRTAPPPVLGRLRLTGQMEIITYDEFGLTMEEIGGLVKERTGKKLSEKEASVILERSGGWAAGVVLMLEGEAGGNRRGEGMIVERPKAAFEYFGNVFYSGFSEKEKKMLAMLSISPAISMDMAEEVTGDKSAQQMIAELNKRNYFVYKHEAEKPVYSFHPLLREFLYSKLKESFKADGGIFAKKAAVILMQNGYLDAAVRLFAEFEDYESLIGLICKEGPSCVLNGRQKTIMAWLELVKGNIVKEEPWLLYWRATSIFFADMPQAFDLYAEALCLFRERNDKMGVYLSWCGKAEAFIYNYDKYVKTEGMIKEIEEIMKKYSPFSSKEIEKRVNVNIFNLMALAYQWHKDFDKWYEKAQTIFFDSAEEKDLHIATMAHLGLAVASLYMANKTVHKKINEKTEKLCNVLKENVFIKINHATSLGAFAAYMGKGKEGLEHIEMGYQIQKESGIKFFNMTCLGFKTRCLLMLGKLKEAEELLADIPETVLENRLVDKSYFYLTMSQLKFFKGDFQGAKEYIDKSQEIGTRDKFMPYAIFYSSEAMILRALKKGKEAEKVLEKGFVRARKNRNNYALFHCFYIKAALSLDNGKEKQASIELKEAFAFGKEKEIVYSYFWDPELMSRLCAFALENNIESDYTLDLIRRHGLKPPEGIKTPGNWPYRVEITLGGKMAISVDGKKLDFGKKPPKMPLELLKLIALSRNMEATEEYISDTLWPDSDGDRAHTAFSVTLKRLRDMLGVEDAIRLSDGRVSLNRNYCQIKSNKIE